MALRYGGFALGGVVAGYVSARHARRRPAAAWCQSAAPAAPVVVVGGGVMGLMTAEALARKGVPVTLLDRGDPIRGSWGATRASHLRVEDPVLLRMGVASISYWLQLQEAYTAAGTAGENTLFYKRSGAMMAGPAAAIRGMSAAVRGELGDLPEGVHEVLDPRAAERRFPQLRMGDADLLYYTRYGYTVYVPTCLACLEWAADQAGVVREEEGVQAISRKDRRITTDSGRSILYSRLVITAGPWTNKVLESAGLAGVPLIVSNEQTVELAPGPGAPPHDWESFPIFTWSEAGYKGQREDGSCKYFYTTPIATFPGSASHGVKIGYHRQGPLLDTEDFLVTSQGRQLKDRLPNDRKELVAEQQYGLDDYAWRRSQEFARAKLPHLDAAEPVGFMRCLYQLTPDLNMIVGPHTEDESVIFACGFSGSGFQFAPAIADCLATCALQHEPTPLHRRMLKKFAPGRFRE